MRWSSCSGTARISATILPRCHPWLSTPTVRRGSVAAAAELHATAEGVLRLACGDGLTPPPRHEPLVLRVGLALAHFHTGLRRGRAATRLTLIERLLAERLALGGVCTGIEAALRGVPRLRFAVGRARVGRWRSEEHTSELQSRRDLVCRLLLEKKKEKNQ